MGRHKAKKLTERQKRFVDEYKATGDWKNSVFAAFPDIPRTSTVHHTYHKRLLANPLVRIALGMELETDNKSVDVTLIPKIEEPKLLPEPKKDEPIVDERVPIEEIPIHEANLIKEPKKKFKAMKYAQKREFFYKVVMEGQITDVIRTTYLDENTGKYRHKEQAITRMASLAEKMNAITLDNAMAGHNYLMIEAKRNYDILMGKYDELKEKYDKLYCESNGGENVKITELLPDIEAMKLYEENLQSNREDNNYINFENINNESKV